MTHHCSSMLSHRSVALPTEVTVQQSEGKMSFLTIASCLLLFVYDSSAVDIMPELKRNILNFGYGVNLNMRECSLIPLIDFTL